MLQTSQDLLFIVLSIAIVWVTVFLCWALYRLAIFLRNLNSTTIEVNSKIVAIDEWFEMTKQRVAHTFSFMSTVSQGVEAALGLLKARKTAAKAKKGAQEEELQQE